MALHRTPKSTVPHLLTIFCSGDLQVDLSARSVQVKGKPVELTHSEFSLLALFVRSGEKVLTNGCLLREIWGITDPAKMDDLRALIGRLREKLKANSANVPLLLQVSGIGYRFAAGKKDK